MPDVVPVLVVEWSDVDFSTLAPRRVRLCGTGQAHVIGDVGEQPPDPLTDFGKQ